MFKAILVGAAALALMSGTANAAVQFYSFGAGAPSMPLVTNFSNDTVGNAPTYAPAGYSWNGDAVVLNSTSSNGAEPVVSNGVYGTGNYLSVEGGQSETLTFAAGVTKVAFYIGSLDSYNDLNFMFSGATNTDITGSALGALTGADNGAQTQANTNGEFVFTFDKPITSVTLGSDSNSFEIASISAAVPEPATWAMMLLGLGGVGAALRNRRKPVAAAAAVA
jgi:hypothetical protein